MTNCRHIRNWEKADGEKRSVSREVPPPTDFQTGVADRGGNESKKGPERRRDPGGGKGKQNARKLTRMPLIRENTSMETKNARREGLGLERKVGFIGKRGYNTAQKELEGSE